MNYSARGFTVIEMLVSISIIGIISAVVLYNYPQFNQEIHMNRAAREVAFAVRTAQAQAVQVQEINPALGAPDNYGIQFTKNSNTFTLFTDGLGGVCEDKRYNASGCTESDHGVTYRLERGVTIEDVTIPDVSGNDISRNELNVLYYRPDPISKVTDGVGGCWAFSDPPPCVSSNGPFKVFIKSADDSVKREIHIWLTGQISIRRGA